MSKQSELMNGIFISYRQDDAKAWALLLRDELARTFGAEHVFLDKDALRAGELAQADPATP